MLKTLWSLLLVVTILGLANPALAGPAADDDKWLLFMDNSVTGLAGHYFDIDPDHQLTLTLEHVGVWSVGDVFAFIDFTDFRSPAPGADEDTWYGEISPRLSLGKLLDRDLSFSVFGRDIIIWKDTLLAVTYERGRDPDLTESLLIGLGFDFDLSAIGIIGDRLEYFQINFYARNELNSEAGSNRPDRGFEDMQITVSAALPFEFGKVKFRID